VEVDYLIYVAEVVSDSKGEEEVDHTVDNMSVVRVDLDHCTVGWDQVEGISSLCRLLGPCLWFYPSPFVPGDDTHVHGNLDVAVGEAIVGTLADW
jgi:hypothetical protein